MKIIPHNYQFSMMSDLLEMEKGGFINAGYGLGKTMVILMFAYYVYKRRKDHVLICVPASTIPNYIRELRNLQFDESFLGYTNNPKTRKEECKKPIVITSYDVLDKVNFTGQNIILDEVTMVKDFTSKRVMELMRIKRENKNNLRFYGLTGAFDTIELKHYFTYFKLVNDWNLRSIDNLNYFLRIFFDEYVLKTIYVKDKKITLTDFKIKKEYKDRIIEGLGKYVKTYNREIYNDLPQHTTRILYSNEACSKRSIKSIKDQYVLETKDNLILAQEISSGFMYDKDSQSVKSYSYEKLKFCVKTIQDLVLENNENVLVFYNFKEEYRYLKNALQSKKIIVKEAREKNAVADWNNGKVNVLVCHPQSGGRGLNLQEGGHIYLWVTLPLSLELYQQAKARLHRQGQKETVTELIVLHSDVDVHVYNILNNKEYISENIREYFK